MILQAVRFMLRLLALGALLTAWLVARPSTYPPIPLAMTPQDAPHGHGLLPVESLAILATRDPFRLDRRPAKVSYDPSADDTPVMAAPQPPRPVLVLTGLILGGAGSGAVIEGLPGVDGSMWLQVGDTAGGLRVRRIGPEEVIVAGLDTVWTLRVGRPWE